MSAALTGGFDTCLELAEKFVDLQGEPAVAALVPPLQNLTLPLIPVPGGPALAGTVRLLLARADVVPAGDYGDGRVTVRVVSTLGLHITGPKPGQLALGAELSLPGLPVTLVPPPTRDGTTQSAFTVTLSGAQVGILPDPGSLADLDTLALQVGVPSAVITGTVAQTLTTALAGLLAAAPALALGGQALQFAKAGQDGRVGQTTQTTFLTDAALATRAETSATPAVLCVFGDLFNRPAPVGNQATKTAVATNIDGAGAFLMAAPAVQRFLLCPAIFRAVLPIWLNHQLSGDSLLGIQLADVPGYATLSQSAQQAIATALSHHQVGNFYNLVLPGGAPPPSYQPALGAAIFGSLPSGVRAVLSDTVAGMASIVPGSCGRAGGLPLPSSELTTLVAGLGDGEIDLSGVIKPTDWGVGGEIRFSASLLPVLQSDGTVALVGGAPVVKSTIELEWYAVALGVLVGAIVGGAIALLGGAPLGGILGAEAGGAVVGGLTAALAVPAILTDIAVGLVTAQLNQLLKQLPAQTLPLPAPAVPQDLTVQPDLLTLQLAIASGTPGNPPLGEPVPAASITTQALVTKTPAGSGTVTIDTDCVRGTFAYQDYTIVTELIMNLTQTGLTPPVSYQWTLDGNPLNSPFGTLAMVNPASSLGYSFSSDMTQLVVISQAGSPPATVSVRCVATGSDGISATAGGGAYVTGFERDLDPSYYAQLAKCIASLSSFIGRLGAKQALGGVVTWQDLAGLIAQLIPGGEGDPRASALLSGLLDLSGAVQVAPQVAGVQQALAISGVT